MSTAKTYHWRSYETSQVNLTFALRLYAQRSNRLAMLYLLLTICVYICKRQTDQLTTFKLKLSFLAPNVFFFTVNKNNYCNQSEKWVIEIRMKMVWIISTIRKNRYTPLLYTPYQNWIFSQSPKSSLSIYDNWNATGFDTLNIILINVFYKKLVIFFFKFWSYKNFFI